jgi:DNA-binding response OmpR family regulator
MSRPAVLGNVAIVVVEDHADIRFTIGQFLRQQGARVVVAANASEGLQAVREHRPDLVLTHIRLPDRDGFELLQEIRRLEAEHGDSVPVIAMTAFGRISDRALAVDFQAYLDKPFSPDKLLRTITSVLKAYGSLFPDDCEKKWKRAEVALLRSQPM